MQAMESVHQNPDAISKHSWLIKSRRAECYAS
jgi:hypothetical protein